MRAGTRPPPARSISSPARRGRTTRSAGWRRAARGRSRCARSWPAAAWCTWWSTSTAISSERLDAAGEGVELRGAAVELGGGVAEPPPLGAHEAGVGRDGVVDAAQAAFELAVELAGEGRHELLAQGGDLGAQLALGGLPPAGNDEQAEHRHHARRQHAGGVGGGAGQDVGDQRSEADRADLDQGGRGARSLARFAGARRLALLVVALDRVLRRAADAGEQPLAIELESPADLADDAVVVLAAPPADVLHHRLPLPQVGGDHPVDHLVDLSADPLRRVADRLLAELRLDPRLVEQVEDPP